MLGILTISSFFSFLKYATFTFGYIQSSNLFPEPLSSDEEKDFLIRFKNGDEEDLFSPDFNINEKSKLLEVGLKRLKDMSYDALTKPQGNVDVIKGAKDVQRLFRLRSGDLRLCYKVNEAYNYSFYHNIFNTSNKE